MSETVVVAIEDLNALVSLAYSGRQVMDLASADLELLARLKRGVAADPAAPEKSALQMADIMELVAGRHGFTVDDLRGPSREGALVAARHVAMRLCRDLTGASYPTIGDAFCCHHTTVMHGCRMAEGVAVGDLVEQLEARR